MDNANIELIRGHMDTIILRTLLSGAKYGLEILNEIRDSSQELYTLKQPTLYNSLKRLEKLGYITSMPGASSNGAKRVYYELTNSGKDFVIEDQRQWEFSRTIIDKLVSDRVFDPAINDKPFDPSGFRPSTKRTSRSEMDMDDEKYENANTYTTLNNESMRDTENSFGSVDDEQVNDIEEVIQKPIMVAKSTNVNDYDSTKFQFTSEIVDKTIIKPVIEDVPSALDALYNEKWEKKPVNDYGYDGNFTPKKADISQPKSDFATFSETINVKNNELSEEEKIAAAAALYAKENAIKETKSTLPDKLTHYDLEVPQHAKRKVDPIAVQNFYKMTSESELERNNNVSQKVDKSAGDNKFSFDIWDGKHNKSTSANVQGQEKPIINSTSVAPTTEITYKKNDKLPEIPMSNNEVNYISTFENIFNSKPTEELPKEVANKEKKADLYHYDNSSQPVKPIALKPAQNEALSYDDEVNFAQLKHKLAGENITLKQYVKSNTTAYYVNKYYYFSKLLRDWSFIAYAIYAVFCIAVYFPSKNVINGSLGVFLGFLLGGLLLPTATTIYWALNPTNRRPTVFNLAHSMITGFILMLGMLMCILLIGFFGVKANMADFKTMLAPIVLPLISLLLIPAFITVYAILYNTKKYHIR